MQHGSKLHKPGIYQLPSLHVTEVPPLHVTEVPPLHVSEVPPLHATDAIQGKGKTPHYSLAPVSSQELPERCWSQRRTALGIPAPDFSSEFTPEALSRDRVWPQGSRGLESGFSFPVDELPSKVIKAHLPDNLTKYIVMAVVHSPWYNRTEWLRVKHQVTYLQ